MTGRLRLVFVFVYVAIICVFDLIGTVDEFDAKLGFGKGLLFSFYFMVALAQYIIFRGNVNDQVIDALKMKIQSQQETTQILGYLEESIIITSPNRVEFINDNFIELF